MTHTIKVKRFGIISSGFQLVVVLVILYLIFYFSRRYSIPYIGTIAKWILIGLLGIIGFFLAIFLFVIFIAILIIILVLIRNFIFRRKLNKMKEKMSAAPKIRVLNPSTNNKEFKRKGNVYKKKENIIVDGDYK